MKRIKKELLRQLCLLLNLVSRKSYYRIIRSKLILPSKYPDDLTVKLAETEEEFSGAFKVLHDAYVDCGYTDRHPSGMRITKYHALGSTYTLIAKKAGRVIGICSVIVNGRFGLPLNCLLPGGVEPNNKGIAEISSLAIDKGSRRYSGQVLFLLLKGMWQLCQERLQLKAMYAVSNPVLLPLYEGILLLRRIKSIKNYEFVKGAPAVVLRLGIEEAFALYRKHYGSKEPAKNLYAFMVSPAMGGADVPNIQVDLSVPPPPVISWEMYHRFFIEGSDLHEKLSPAEREYLGKYYAHIPASGKYFSGAVEQDNALRIAS